MPLKLCIIVLRFHKNLHQNTTLFIFSVNVFTNSDIIFLTIFRQIVEGKYANKCYKNQRILGNLITVRVKGLLPEERTYYYEHSPKF